MGQSSSRVNTEIINANDFNVDQSVMNDIQSNCTSSQKQTNVLQIVGSRVRNLRTDQSNIARNLCVLQTMVNDTRDTNLTNNVLNKLAQQIEAKGGLPGTGGTSESVSKMYNTMRANLNQSTVNRVTKDCILKQDQNNVIQIFGSDVSDSNLAQVNHAFVDCVQAYDDVRNVTGDLTSKAKNELDQSLKSSSMDLTASMGVSMLPSIISLGLVIVLIIIVVSMMKNPDTVVEIAQKTK